MDVLLFTDKVNMIIGAFTAIMTYIFGANWMLFAFFLGFNCLDFITRWMAARINGTENSQKCFVGILKKLGYWIMVLLGFSMSIVFVQIGKVLGIDLKVTFLLGWFVLSTLMINEIRSILENLVEAGFKIPMVLVKGLDVVSEIIEEVEGKEDKDE